MLLTNQTWLLALTGLREMGTVPEGVSKDDRPQTDQNNAFQGGHFDRLGPVQPASSCCICSGFATALSDSTEGWDQGAAGLSNASTLT